MYDYKRSTSEERVSHSACIIEEWHAYVCDLSDAPSWIGDDATGLCCHSHRLILIDTAEEEVVLRVEREAEFYEWRCFATITCDPLVDEHGRECERLNDEARTEFYADLVAEDIGNLVAWHVAEAMSTWQATTA